MQLHRFFVLEEANEQNNNNNSKKMDFDFDGIENYVRSEENISLSGGNTKDYFGPKCKDPKQFKFKLGDRLIIKRILRIVKENR